MYMFSACTDNGLKHHNKVRLKTTLLYTFILYYFLAERPFKTLRPTLFSDELR